MAPTTKDEPKRSLQVNDPEASYVSPDLSFQDGTGTLPEEEQDWHDERDQAREDEVEAAAEAEDKIATARAKAAEDEAKQAETATTKQAETKAAVPKATTS